MYIHKIIYQSGEQRKPLQVLFLTLVLGLFVMVSQGCSEDLLQQESSQKPDYAGERLYFSLDLAPAVDMSGATRASSTEYPHDTEYDDDMDHLEGEGYENTVNDMAVILVNPDDHETVLLSLPFNRGVSTSSDKNKIITGKAELDYAGDADVRDFINMGMNTADKKVKAELYVICNYTGNSKITLPAKGKKISEINLLTIASESELNYFGGKTGGTGASSVIRPFLMTNADYQNKDEDDAHNKYVTTIDISKLLAATDITKAYNINPRKQAEADTGETDTTEEETKVLEEGAESGSDEGEKIIIPVQRALARIDLNINSNTYYFDDLGNSMEVFTGDGSEEWATKLKIDYVALANINKNFNLFKAAGKNPTIDGTTNGTLGTDWSYFWAEMPSKGNDARFVQDPKYSSKNSLTSMTSENVASSANAFYYNYFFDKNFLNNIRTPYNENLGTKYHYSPTETDYIIWRYVTPNTIHEPANQKLAISTGVIFVSELNFNKSFEQEGVMDNPAHAVLEDKDGEIISYPEFDATPIYMWNGTPIGTNRRLQEIVKNPKNSRQLAISAAYKEAVSGEEIYTTFDEWKEKWHNNGTEEEPILVPAWADFTTIEDWDYTYPEPSYLAADKKISEEWKKWAEDTKEGEEFEGTTELTNLKKKQLHFLAYNVLPDFAEELVKNGFSIIIPTKADDKGHSQYLCYYYGWLRHNNNNDPLVMGPMEFGVVRNNVYQVSVKKISHIGHPFPGDIPTDPEPPTPGEDDEPKDPYIELCFKALPWNVKVNDDITLGH